MDSEKHSQKYWQQIPHLVLSENGAEEKTTSDLEAVKQVLEPADRILDLGCGWGRITCALATSGYDVVGIDLSENLLRYARQQAKESALKIKFSLGSMLNIPYPKASFDKIICLASVYNHLLTPKDQIKALNEIYRVLAPGGLAYIEMGNGESKKYRQLVAAGGYGHQKRVFDLQIELAFKRKDAPPNVLYLHDRATLTQLAKQSKFARFRVKFLNINHKRRIATYLFKDCP